MNLACNWEIKMLNKKLLSCGVLSFIFISATVHADLTDWYKKTPSATEQPVPDKPIAKPVENQAPQNTQYSQQGVQNKPSSNAQNRVNQSNSAYNNQNQNSNSSLEARMNGLNATIENLSKFNNGSKDNLTNNYLNIVQLIVISEATKSLDGKDNRGLINNMLAGVVSCQNKYKVNVIQQVNNQLPRDVATTVQKYLGQNSQSISGNSECLI